MIASFAGSLQAGLVNTAVLRTAILQGKSDARWLALGGAVPELIYAMLAYLPGNWLATAIADYLWLVKYTMALMLLAIGVMLIRDRTAVQSTAQSEVATDKAAGFLKGFGLGIINLQLLLFWIGVKLTLVSYWPAGLQALTPVWGIVAFGLGAMTGALLLLLLIAEAGAKISSGKTIRLLNLLMGWLLVLVALATLLADWLKTD